VLDRHQSHTDWCRNESRFQRWLVVLAQILAVVDLALRAISGSEVERAARPGMVAEAGRASEGKAVKSGTWR